MRLLKNMENLCLNIYSVEKAICNMNLSVLQELGILLGGLSDCEELVVVARRRLKLLNCTEYQGL